MSVGKSGRIKEKKETRIKIRRKLGKMVKTQTSSSKTKNFSVEIWIV